jgi:small subunit ribosomal protein S1
VSVVVLSVDQEKHRISLGLKQAEPNPWDNITERYPVNEMRPGKVKRITEFGAFIELETGIDGLLHISEISEQRIKTVSEKLKVGDEVQVRILKVDADGKRISLSMKPLPAPPTPEELAAAAKAAAKAAKKTPAKSRRGGLEADWMGAGLGSLDPSKFGAS